MRIAPGEGSDGDGHTTNEEGDPGLWGPDGILTVPHVKMVLVLAVLVEVRHVTYCNRSRLIGLQRSMILPVGNSLDLV